MSGTWALETRAIHNQSKLETAYGATSVPIYLSAGFEETRAEDLEALFAGKRPGHIYSRISNPTVMAFEQRLNALEDGLGAIVVSSGLAAITGVAMTLCESGDEFVTSKSLFGGTMDLFEETLSKFGIRAVYVDATDGKAVADAVTDKTRFIFVESLGNPGLDIPDFDSISKTANSRKIPFVVDNTLTTPFLFQPKDFGAHLVVHSTTKYICGNGSAVGGALIDLGTFDWKQTHSVEVKEASKKFGQFAFLARARRHILHNAGSCLSPVNAFIAQNGLETLGLRIKQHCQNALELAHRLSAHSAVKSVDYPGLSQHPYHAVASKVFNGGFGAILTVTLDSKETCFRVINQLKLVKNIANLGDTKTLVIHPASTIFQDRSGVAPGLIRVSVGIENIDDIWADFKQALEESST